MTVRICSECGHLIGFWEVALDMAVYAEQPRTGIRKYFHRLCAKQIFTKAVFK